MVGRSELAPAGSQNPAVASWQPSRIPRKISTAAGRRRPAFITSEIST
jgi:hypothetical protein